MMTHEIDDVAIEAQDDGMFAVVYFHVPTKTQKRVIVPEEIAMLVRDALRSARRAS